MNHRPLDTLSDHQLLHRVEDLIQRGNALTAELLAHLGEVDARRLYAEAGHPSMFDWCTRVLGLSEGAAYKRSRAARATRQFPALLEWLAAGRLHLAGVCLLAPHLTEEGHLELLEAASGKSKREVEGLVADLTPSPPVPDSIRRLPAQETVVGGGGGARRIEPEPTTAPAPPAAPPAVPPTPRRPEVSPLGADRYRIQFTASGALVEKLREVQALSEPSAKVRGPGLSARMSRGHDFKPSHARAAPRRRGPDAEPMPAGLPCRRPA